MTWRTLFLLFMISFFLLLFVVKFQDSPGYMDAEYYYAGGLRLVEGYGFTEEILWNYLDDPVGLPHPSHTYWMPLASILAAIGMALSGISRFSTARIPFILVAALVPPVTALLSFQLNRRKDMAILSGGLAIFSVFYLAYLPTTDIFGVAMFLGGISLSLYASWIQGRERINSRNAFFLGLCAGLIHLARTDGITWLFVSLLVLVSGLFSSKKKGEKSVIYIRYSLLCLMGYLVIMGPWMIRNISLFGVPFPPGGTRALWIKNFDEIYIYPGSRLTLARWWSTGLEEILKARIWAAGQNLQTALAVQGEIFLVPLVLFGAWRLRNNLVVRAGMAIWFLTFLIMTVVFPFQGARGGFFHSGAAIQPLIWTLAPLGLESILEWGERHRDWDIPQARRFFQIGLMIMAILLTAFIAFNRVSGSGGQVTWEANHEKYIGLEEGLRAQGASLNDIVMVNNSPGYFVATGRSSISIPYGDLQSVEDAAYRYGARYLILEIDQLQGEDRLFDNPGDRPGLRYLGILEETRMFEFSGP